jgi:hypothetical protein
MNIHVNAHGGGAAGSAAVSSTGTTVIVPDTGHRRYLIVQASKDNTGPVFLRMSQTESAELGKGIVLWPGDFHEWSWNDMYWGPIRGIVAEGVVATVYWHEGK